MKMFFTVVAALLFAAGSLDWALVFSRSAGSGTVIGYQVADMSGGRGSKLTPWLGPEMNPLRLTVSARARMVGGQFQLFSRPTWDRTYSRDDPQLQTSSGQTYHGEPYRVTLEVEGVVTQQWLPFLTVDEGTRRWGRALSKGVVSYLKSPVESAPQLSFTIDPIEVPSTGHYAIVLTSVSSGRPSVYVNHDMELRRNVEAVDPHSLWRGGILLAVAVLLQVLLGMPLSGSRPTRER